MKFKQIIVLAGLTWLLAGCLGEQDGSAAGMGQQTITREVDFALVSRGGMLFAKNCAECHGAKGEGDANWRQADANGMFPPPPLNGTGHAWHHPQSVLHQVIKHGSPGGQGRMPPWKERLSDEEIAAIIAWFQAQWPDEVYAAWQQMNERARAGS